MGGGAHFCKMGVERVLMGTFGERELPVTRKLEALQFK